MTVERSERWCTGGSDLGVPLSQAAPQAVRLGPGLVQPAPQVSRLPLAVPQHLQTLLLPRRRQELRARPLLQLGGLQGLVEEPHQLLHGEKEVSVLERRGGVSG